MRPAAPLLPPKPIRRDTADTSQVGMATIVILMTMVMMMMTMVMKMMMMMVMTMVTATMMIISCRTVELTVGW